MKKLWNSFKVAFAMFSKIPMPRADWTKDNMKYMLCFFPVIGLVIGALVCGAYTAGKNLGYGDGFLAGILCLIPILITGGIHVDGLLDTSDALSSWQERSRRLEILKDSHAGAFAIITCCTYGILFFASYTQIVKEPKAVYIAALGFAASRCLSGFGVVTIPKATESGTVAQFSKNSSEKTVQVVLVVFLAAVFSLMVVIQPVQGVLAAVCCVLVFLWYRYKAMKYFGGTTGDLSGYFLCTCELVTAAALALSSVFFAA